MIGWLVDKFSGKAVRKLVGKYRPKMIWSVIIMAVAAIAAIFGVCEVWIH